MRGRMGGSKGHNLLQTHGSKASVLTFARLRCAEDEARCDCSALQQALGMLPGAARMVVGHTIQDAGINSACGERVFRIDVGLSKGCGNGEPEVGRERPYPGLLALTFCMWIASAPGR